VIGLAKRQAAPPPALSILASSNIRDLVGPVTATQLPLEMPASGASFEEEVDYWKEPAKRRGCIGGLA
jgi:hypothetical protein